MKSDICSFTHVHIQVHNGGLLDHFVYCCEFTSVIYLILSMAMVTIFEKKTGSTPSNFFPIGLTLSKTKKRLSNNLE